MTEKIEIGTFQIVSGVIMLSDPCYPLGTWCQGELSNTQCGAWRASVVRFDDGESGNRVAALGAFHEGLTEFDSLKMWYSGQAGIFDRRFYRSSQVIAESVINGLTGDDWYDLCCQLTMKHEIEAGMLPYGVVSSSGYGDGGYKGIVFRNEIGMVAGIIIDYRIVPEHELISLFIEG